MLEQLKIIEGIARRNSFVDHADLVLELINMHDSDSEGFTERINSSFVWGGAGSLIDISLSAYSRLSPEMVKSDEYKWRSAFIELGAKLNSNGQVNPAAAQIAEAFDNWKKNETGI